MFIFVVSHSLPNYLIYSLIVRYLFSCIFVVISETIDTVSIAIYTQKLLFLALP